MRVVVTGGGTAGHIYPALTVAARLVAAHDEVTFIGTPQGLEARLVPEAGVPFHALASKGFDRARPITLITAAFVTLLSTVKAFRLFGRLRPAVVIAFGAYVSLPVGIAARLRGIPLVLHEQNSVPGLANRILSRWATAVGITYEESASLLAHPERATITGNPVRESVLQARRETGRERLGVDEDSLVLLAFGGSRGARHLNDSLVALAPRLMEIEQLVVVHVAGAGEYGSVKKRVQGMSIPPSRWLVFDYMAELGDVIAAADVVVSRAGATTIAELTALGAPALVVPYPFATEDHQTLNAKALEAHGAAVLVADSDLDTPRFSNELIALLTDGRRRATMSAASRALGRPDAVDRVWALAVAAARPAASSIETT